MTSTNRPQIISLSASRVTRKDVARLAGTSVAVVSYVINNGPRPVAASTRARVEEAIVQTGYRPNAIARALAYGATQTYGLIVPNVSNPFIASLAHNLLQTSVKRGHIMLLGDAGDDSQRELEVVQSLLNRQVDGLIYTSTNRHPYIDIIRASGTPLVMLDEVPSQPGVKYLKTMEREAAFTATEHLLKHGYREIGVIGGPIEMFNAHDRLQGWIQALEQYQLPINPQWIVRGEYSLESGYRAANILLSRGAMPRALFVCNEPMTIGCMRALNEHGLKVPEDIALISFNGTAQGSYLFPSLSSVCQPVEEIAEQAIALLDHFHTPMSGKHISHYLQIGESCGCSPQHD